MDLSAILALAGALVAIVIGIALVTRRLHRVDQETRQQRIAVGNLDPKKPA